MTASMVVRVTNLTTPGSDATTLAAGSESLRGAVRGVQEPRGVLPGERATHAAAQRSQGADIRASRAAERWCCVELTAVYLCGRAGDDDIVFFL